MSAVAEALGRLGASLAAAPEKARVKNVPARARLVEGLRWSVEGPNGESVHADMPRPMGGTGSAPNPGWLMRAALAACTGTAIAMRAASQGIALATLEVSVESMSDNRGLLGLDDGVSAAFDAMAMTIRIGAPGRGAAELEALARWGDAHSPVGCTLRRGFDYAVKIEVEPGES
jgi:uncharacterized OsmC-like protein